MDARSTRAARARRRAVEAALQLFAEHGYDETTVEAITEHAGISLRTFYRYFDAKHGVLAEAGSGVIRQVLDHVEEHDIDNLPIVTLATLLGETIDRGIRDGPLAIQTRLVRQNPELQEKAALWRQGWAQQLATGLAERQGKAAPTLEHVTTSTLAIELVAVALDQWLARGPDVQIATCIDDVVRILRANLDRPARPGSVRA